MTLSNYLHTLRHLQPTQLLHRLGRPLRSRVPEYFYPRPEPPARLSSLHSPFSFAANDAPSEVPDYLRGEFTFVGRSDSRDPNDLWHTRSDDDLLWQFNLQYFGWAQPLAMAWRADAQEQAAEFALRAISAWIDAHPFAQQPAWHPYPTSRRLQNWGIVLAALQDAPGWDEHAPNIVSSIAQQADYLADWPELELAGNHLLANYHALTWTYLQFGELLPDRIADKLHDSAFYTEQLARQTLADGCHEERSTSYHISVLKDAFELWLLRESVADTELDGWKSLITKMFDLLASMIQPNGDAPLVNDSVRGYPIQAAHLLAAGAAHFQRPDLKYVAELGDSPDRQYLRWTLGDDGESTYDHLTARPPSFTSRPNETAGYTILRDDWTPDADWALLDCGPIGPDHQPGHAHADTLQILLAIDGEPLVVDPGTYTYDRGDWRNHFRGTPAHNTVTVDGADSSEVWHAFRVARRATAQLDEFDGESMTATGTHDGYTRLPDPVTHHRTVSRAEPDTWHIHDHLESGGAQHHYQLTYQLAPNTTAEKQSRAEINVETNTGLLVIFELEGPADLTWHIEQGWVSEGWREKERAPRLVGEVRSGAAEVELTTKIHTAEG